MFGNSTVNSNVGIDMEVTIIAFSEWNAEHSFSLRDACIQLSCINGF
jgi:hypothetical protein